MMRPGVFAVTVLATIALRAPVQAQNAPALDPTLAAEMAVMDKALQDVEAALAPKVRPGLSIQEVAVVEGVAAAGSPAQKAQFQNGDIVKEIAGNPVTSAESLLEIVRGLPQRAPVLAKIVRARRELTLAATLDDWDAAATPGQERGRLGLPVTTHIVAQKIEAGSIAQKMGLVGGERLYYVNTKRVGSAMDVALAFAKAPANGEMSMIFRRPGTRRRAGVRMSPDGKVTSVPEDALVAEAGGLRSASALAEEVRAGKTGLQGQKVDVVAVTRQVFPRTGGVSVFLDISDENHQRTDDTICAEFPNGPLADAMRKVPPGYLLAFRAVISRAEKEQKEDADYVNSDAFLDNAAGAATAPKIVTLVRLDFAVEGFLTIEEKK